MKINMLRKNNQKGFTLIELLVVISIIALLSSVVLASLREARDRAAWSKFDQEVRQLKTAVMLYRDENNGEFPFDSGWDNMTVALEKLNDQGLFTLNELKDPMDNNYYSHPNINSYFSCGDNSFPSEAHFIILASGNLEMQTNIRKYSQTMKVFHYRGDPAPNYWCTEITY